MDSPKCSKTQRRSLETRVADVLFGGLIVTLRIIVGIACGLVLTAALWLIVTILSL